MDQITPTARLRLEDHVAVVTGGSRGIGEGIVRRFVEEGAKVVFSDLLNDKGKGLRTRTGQKRRFLPGRRYKCHRDRGAHEIRRKPFQET
jgi:NAD(P)-dependent dehydrogenase (short-subunit alcohol dehydrogenase family)